MSVVLNPPSQLGFNRPLTVIVRRSLTVTNPNNQPVAFKVKTTAPRLYCVRPNSGRIEPGQSVDVQVLLQPMREEPPLSSKCKDKFLVQTTLITAYKEQLGTQEMWNPTDDKDESRIHQQKIKVVYLPPEGQVVEEEQEVTQTSTLTLDDSRYDTVRGPPNGIANYVDSEPEPPMVIAPSPPPQVLPPPPQQVRAAAADFIVESTRQADYEPPTLPTNSTLPSNVTVSHDTSTAHPTVNISVHTPPPQPRASLPNRYSSASPAPLDSAALETHTRVAELADEVSRLRTQITSLQAENASLSIRRRTAGAANTVPMSEDGSILPGDVVSEDGTYQTYTGTYTEGSIVTTDGVPPQIVVVIALSVFVATYLFF